VGSVVADDGDRLAALQPEYVEADRQGADFLQRLRPGPGLPDAEVLLAQRRPIAMGDGIAQQ
jgi:hypothetical protein